MADGKGVTVLFLGSGFSKAVGGVPIQKDFIKFLLSSSCHRRWLDSYKVRIGEREIDLSQWIEEVGDIEVCMSHLHNMAYSGLAKKRSQARHDAKKAIINLRVVMTEKLKDRSWERCEENFRNWVDTLKRKHTLVIMTTNYDLLVESFLKQYRYPGIDKKLGRNTNGPQVYKLHGSVNWMEKRHFDGRELIGLKRLSMCVWNQWGYEPAEQRGYRVYPNNRGFWTPVIIPFFFQKDEWLVKEKKARWSPIFEPHWKSAQDCLVSRKVDLFYFIGCALPAADTYLMSWLLDIFQKNKPETIKIVCDGDAGNLSKALSPFINPEKDIYKCGLEHFLEGHAKS